MGKRILSLCVAFVLCVFILPFPTLAEGQDGALATLQAASDRGDNYPYADKVYGRYWQPDDVDPWNFFYRECTSFVAWCLNSRNGVAFHNHMGGGHWGNANNWGATAQALGYAVDNSPAVGSVAWSNAGYYGHVAWVSAVNGGNVTIEEYNYSYSNPGRFGTRTVATSSFTGYIHIKDLIVPDPLDLGDSFSAFIYSPSLDRYITNDGANITSRTRTGAPNQLWNFERNGNGSYKITSAADGKTWDVANYGTSSGVNVQAISYAGNTAQQWDIYGSEGAYYFSARCTDCVLDIAGGSSDDGANIQMYAYNGSGAQLFSIAKAHFNNVADIGSDFYAYIYATSMNRYITNDNSNVSSYSKRGTSEQIWHFERLNDGAYKITSDKDGNSWDVSGYGATDETNVHMMPYVGNTAQQWFIYGSEGEYRFNAKCTNCVIDISNGSYDEGTNIWMYHSNNSNAQNFSITKLDSIKVILDANGGTASSDYIIVSYNGNYENLIEPTRSGYAFDGWYTSKDTEEKITADTKVTVTDNHTLYAHWTATQPILTSELQIAVESKSASKGVTVDIPVTIQKNPGISGAALTVSYDKSVLTLNAITKGSIFEVGSYTAYPETGVVSWYHTENVTDNGTLFTLQFEVSENASNGNYTIAVGVRDGIPANLSNADSEIVDAQFISGVLEITSGVRGDVTGDGVVAINDVVKVARAVAGNLTLTETEKTLADVTGDGVTAINDVVKLARYVAGNIASLQSAEDASLSDRESAVIEVATVSGAPGGTVRVPVSITSNPGIAGAQLNLSFDEGLALKNIATGDVLSVGTFNPDVSAGKVQWYYDQANVTNTGVLFTLEFEVNADAKNGDAYAIAVNVTDGITANLSDYDSNPVNAEFKPGEIQINETADNAVINTVSRNGSTVTANVVCANGNASIFCGVYNNSGKMIAVRSVQVTSESNYQFQFDGQQFDYAKVFIVDSNFCPLCEAKRT